MSTESGNCWNCGNPLTALDYGRQDSCSKCGRDTRTCKGCIYYDRACNNECREPQADRVVEKERANFCDYFKPAQNKNAAATSKDAMRSAAESLFKKK